MMWKEEPKEFTAHLSKIDKVYVKNTILFKHRIRVVWYANRELPRVQYLRWFNLDYPWKIDENTFTVKYPVLNKIFKFFGIKCPGGETSEYLSMEDIKVKYKRIYRLMCKIQPDIV